MATWAFSSGFKWGDLHVGMMISNFIFQLKLVTSTDIFSISFLF